MIVDRYAKGSRIGLDVDVEVAVGDGSVFIKGVDSGKVVGVPLPSGLHEPLNRHGGTVHHRQDASATWWSAPSSRGGTDAKLGTLPDQILDRFTVVDYYRS